MNNKQITNNKTLDKRNPPPLAVSWLLRGMRAPLFTFKQKKGKQKQKPKTKNNLFHVQIIIPVGCQIFRRIRKIEKDIPIGVVERMSQRKTDGL
jgi:hypothetical protein